jgi:hypothetical protein
MRLIVCGHFTIRARVRALTVRGDVPSDVMHVNLALYLKPIYYQYDQKLTR